MNTNSAVSDPSYDHLLVRTDCCTISLDAKGGLLGNNIRVIWSVNDRPLLGQRFLEMLDGDFPGLSSKAFLWTLEITNG